MAVGASGIDIRQMSEQLVFRAFLQGLGGAIVTSGTCNLRLYELQDDGTLKSYDFDSDTFTVNPLVTETASMTHRTGNSGATNTGLWTVVLSTLTGFTPGAIYIAQVEHASALPTVQTREFQFGAGNNAYDLPGQVRRIHALAGGTTVSKDHSQTNPTWVHRDESDSADLVTRTRTVAAEVETVTPS